ncbi:MAG: hypothetical protein DMD81_15905 [Candidatus Rokuibacteriota bacterium]|nr:MAG: hypothetical protein DMD81_15905 [Candidatus Rokubacteria bacterium]
MRGSTKLLALSVPGIVRAIVIGAVATLVAVTTATWAGPRLTALEWSTYDRWLRDHPTSPGRQMLVVVARDAASEARLGSGAWDRAVLARVISGLARAGAGAIGVDVRLGTSGGRARGGPSSDALLSQATKLAETVVYPIALEPARGDGRTPGGPTLEGHSSWPMRSRIPLKLADAAPSADSVTGLVREARAIGHTLAPADPDGVVRRVPLFVASGDRAVPAFALALAVTRMNASPESVTVERGSLVIRPQPATGITSEIHVSVDARANVLVDYRVRGAAARVVPFQEIWTAIEAGQIDVVQQLVDDRVVLILGEPGRELRQTPIGPMSDMEIQVHALDTLASGQGLRGLPTRWIVPGALVVATLVAWLGLTRRWWMGPPPPSFSSPVTGRRVRSLSTVDSCCRSSSPAWPS